MRVMMKFVSDSSAELVVNVILIVISIMPLEEAIANASSTNHKNHVELTHHVHSSLVVLDWNSYPLR